MDRILKELEGVRSHFAEVSVPSSKQSGLLKKNIMLLREGNNDLLQLSASAQSRHKIAQRHLKVILADSNLGQNAFYLCAYALSPSTLAGVEDFVARYREWWEAAVIPKGFTTHMTTLSEDESQDVISSESSSITRPRTDDKDQPRQTAPTEAYSGTNLEALRLASPMGGTVYALDRLEIIRALLEGEPRGKLTIPNIPGLPPFIMFDCTETMAAELLRKGEKIM